MELLDYISIVKLKQKVHSFSYLFMRALNYYESSPLCVLCLISSDIQHS